MSVLDGGLATELQRRGFAIEGPWWSTVGLLTERGREAVTDAHAAFLRAGAEIVTANTFRTNLRAITAAGGDAAEAERLTAIAVDLARSAIDRCGAGRLAASVAPVAECYDPTAVPGDDAALESEHRWFAALLARLGVRLALIETMNCIREAVIATRSARAHGLTPWVSFAVGRGGRLLSGEPVAAAATAVERAGAAAVLVNCSDLSLTRAALSALPGGCRLPVGAYPNVEDRSDPDACCGAGHALPVALGPGSFAEAMTELIDEFSLSIVGGCCGAAPAHIAAVATALERRARDA